MSSLAHRHAKAWVRHNHGDNVPNEKGVLLILVFVLGLLLLALLYIGVRAAPCHGKKQVHAANEAPPATIKEPTTDQVYEDEEAEMGKSQGMRAMNGAMT